MNTIQKQHLSEISKCFEGLGVKEYFMVFNDPDSHDVLSSYSGSYPWLTGVLQLKQEEIKHLWLYGKYKPEEEWK